MGDDQQKALPHVLYTWIWDCLEKNRCILGVQQDEVALAPAAFFLDLCNGHCLNAIMLYIYPVARCDLADPRVPNAAARLRNLRTLLRNIQAFYLSLLNQRIVMPLPDLLAIARQPYVESVDAEMKKLLLLLLGCVVQSDRREQFINQIKCLDTAVQQSLVDEIRKITVDGQVVLNVDACKQRPADNDATLAMFVDHLCRLVKERDDYAEQLLEINQEQESDGSSSPSLAYGYSSQRKLPESQQTDYSNDSAAAVAAASRHISVEVADLRAQLRRCKQEIEEKVEIVNLYKDEMVEKDAEFARLRQENFELVKSVRLLNEYRDEVDVLRERTIRYQQLEAECEKYKEKLGQFDFHKCLAEELREENDMLLETRTLLEDQISSLRERLAQFNDKEADIIRLRRRIADLEQETQFEHRQVQRLLEENAELAKESFIRRSSQLSLSTEHMNGNDSPANREVGCLSQSMCRLDVAKEDRDNPADEHDEALETTGNDLKACPMNLMNELGGHQRSWKVRIRQLERRESELTKQLLNSEAACQALKAELTSTLAECQTLKGQSAIYGSDQWSTMEKQLDTLKASNAELSDRNAALQRQVDSAEANLRQTQQTLKTAEVDQLTLESRCNSAVRQQCMLKQENETLQKSLDTAHGQLERAVCDLEAANKRLEKHVDNADLLDNIRAKNQNMETDRKRLGQRLELLENKLTALGDDLVREKVRSSALDQLSHDVHVCMEEFQVATSNGEDKAQDVRVLYWHLIAHLRGMINETQAKVASKDRHIDYVQQKLIDVQSKLDAKYTAAQCGGVDDKLTEELRKINNLLIDENTNIRQQVVVLQEQIDQLENKLTTTTNANDKLMQQVREMQFNSVHQVESENASLHVELRSLQLNYDVIKGDNAELQRQCETWERNAEQGSRNFKELRAQHQSLLNDHERLQGLHEHLNLDYEQLRKDAQNLKAQLRRARQGCQEHVALIEQLKRQQDNMSRTCAQLEATVNMTRQDDRALNAVRCEYESLKNDYSGLQARFQELIRAKDALYQELRRVKTDSSCDQLKATQNLVKLESTEDLCRRLQLDLARSEEKCDALTVANRRLVDERQALLKQVDAVLLRKDSRSTVPIGFESIRHECSSRRTSKETHTELNTSVETSKRKHRSSAFVKRAVRVFSPQGSSKKRESKDGGGGTNLMSSTEDSTTSTDEAVGSAVTRRTVSSFPSAAAGKSCHRSIRRSRLATGLSKVNAATFSSSRKNLSLSHSHGVQSSTVESGDGFPRLSAFHLSLRKDP